jgi:hypothetical protein
MSTISQRMWMLAHSFPTLQRWEMDHAGEDFDGSQIQRALREPWVTDASRHALMFIGDIWNSDGRDEWPPRLRNSTVVDAFRTWDDEHRAAALAWFRDPWWP